MPRKSAYHRSIMCPDACCDEHSHIFCQVDTVCWASVHCMCTFRGPILWVMMFVQLINLWTNPMGHVQRTNPMGICCMGTRFIKESDACTEDQLISMGFFSCIEYQYKTSKLPTSLYKHMNMHLCSCENVAAKRN